MATVFISVFDTIIGPQRLKDRDEGEQKKEKNRKKHTLT
jgi:hypothetical protein